MERMKMQKCLLTCLLVFGIGFANLATAQDEGSAAKTKTPEMDFEKQAEMQRIIMSKVLAKAGLSDEQKIKTDEILKANLATMISAQKQMATFMSAEETKTFGAAMKMAKKAGYDQPKAEAYAFKKLKMPEDRKSKYTKLKTQLDAVNKNLFGAIGDLLTPEQLDKVPMLKNMMPKEVGAEGSAAKGSASKGSATKGSAAKAGSSSK